MNLEWNPVALRSVQQIHDYIARRSPSRARAVSTRPTNRSRQIGESPYSGRVVPEFGTDEVREVIEHPYRIWYPVKGDVIEVLAVLHGARDASD